MFEDIRYFFQCLKEKIYRDIGTIKKSSWTRLETENVVHRDCKAAMADGGKLQLQLEGKIRCMYEPDIPERAALTSNTTMLYKAY